MLASQVAQFVVAVALPQAHLGNGGYLSVEPRPPQNVGACTNCGAENNCCNAGGSWYGTCGLPGDEGIQHTWESGWATCKKVKSGREGTADKEEGVSDCWSWCKSVFDGQHNDPVILCSSDQCSGCDFCSTESKNERAKEHAEATEKNAEVADAAREEEQEKIAEAEQKEEAEIEKAEQKEEAEIDEANQQEEAEIDEANQQEEAETDEAKTTEQAKEEKVEAEEKKEEASDAVPTIATQRPAQPAGSQGGNPGDDCWTACDKTPGKCFDEKNGKGFCGKAGMWAGSCCRLGAVGELQSPECGNRGCNEKHCCVEDAA